MRKSALYAFGLVVAVLVALGLVVLSSASEPNAVRLTGNAYHFLFRQGLFVLLGVLVAAGAATVDYRVWRDVRVLSWLFAAVVFAFLLVVFLFPATKGSQRWIPMGLFNFQPSEFAKIAVVVWMSMWMDRAGWKVETFMKGTLWPLVFLAVMVAPILLEPDYGSSTVVFTAGILVMFVAGSRVRYMAPFGLLAVAIVGTLVALNPNRMARLFAFFSETTTDNAAGYQAYNSLVAIANGGLWGAGLGQSMQKQYYLPEAHTDFVLAIGAEELGLLFSVGVLVLFFLFFALSVYIARQAADRFGRYLVVGLSYLVFAQAMANVGVVSKALPTKGLALPFFSYGGTNMIGAFFAVGLILSVGIHSYRARKHPVAAKVLMRKR